MDAADIDFRLKTGPAHQARRAVRLGAGLRRLVLASCVGATIATCDANAMATEVQRDVLALYDSTTEAEPRTTRLHRFLELPLNHLGYRLTYWDVASGMPGGQEIDSAVAVISWLDAPVRSPGFAEWCAGRNRIKNPQPAWIVFGHPGVSLDGPASATRDVCLRIAGLELSKSKVRLGALTRTVALDAAMLRNTDDILPPMGQYPQLRALPGFRVHLGVSPAGTDLDRVDLVVTGPSSAYVSDAATLDVDPRLPVPVWHLDVFALLETVLGDAPRPVPDVTTALGRRLFFATVGPDGWLSRLPAWRYGETPVLASDALLSLLRDDVPDVPASVAVVASDLDARHASETAAPAMFALPQVEAASAGTSGVQTWSFYETFDAAREKAAIRDARAENSQDDRALLSSAVDSLSTFLLSERARFAATSGLPRRYVNHPFSLEGEIEGGLAAVAGLAPPGRGAALFFWSGDAMPFEEALAMTGVPAIGGGGAVAPDAPWVAGQWPFSAPVGRQRQVYHALTGWTMPSTGPDEGPRRLKPFQIVFSPGDLLDVGARYAIRRALMQASVADLLPIETSRHVRHVMGFGTVRLTQLSELSWRIEDRGALATLRVDHASGLAVDLAASPGVIGARRREAALYIALDPSVDTPVVTLIDSDAGSGMVMPPTRSGVESARWWLSGLEQKGCDLSFEATGFGRGEFTIVTQPRRAAHVSVVASTDSKTKLFDATVVADDEGRLAFTAPAITPGSAVRVSVVGGCGA